MPSFSKLALIASTASLALAAPLHLTERDASCVPSNPNRAGVIGCNASDLNGPVPSLNLLTAGNFAALSQTGISAVPIVAITGDIGVAPAALSYITGFSLSATGGSYYSTSYMVTGKIYGADSTSSPTPLAVNQALGAYTDGSTRDNYSYKELASGTLDGLSLYKGLYNWSTDVTLNAGETVYLNGNLGDVFIFQAAGAFEFGNGSKIILGGTLTQDSIYFIGATTATFGSGSQFYGVALTYTDIIVKQNAALTAHLYSQTQINFLAGATLTGNPLVAQD